MRGMARRLRIQYEGALYHVINRGNYRRDVFETAATAQAFEATLAEACERYRWQLHAHVIMRNHYHLALETPQPNMVEGMHWLQSTFATRFNRFRTERGHLFQGRYQALLIEDNAALARVVDYIHLNPVRAKIVLAEQVTAFRWSSLPRFVRGPRPRWLAAAGWLEASGLRDTPEGWKAYVKHLIELSADPGKQEKFGFAEMSKGWAIGTSGWRKAVAKDHAHLAITAGIARNELCDLKMVRWQDVLNEAMRDAKKTMAEAKRDPKSAAWKISVAHRLRREADTPSKWIAEMLSMGRPSSVRVYLCRPEINKQRLDSVCPSQR